MGKQHQKEENIESDKITAYLMPLLKDRKWVIIYEGIAHEGSVILGHPKSNREAMIAAIEYAANLLKFGSPYRGEDGEMRIAEKDQN